MPQYFLKSPGKERRSFSIIERHRASGKSINKTLALPELDSINGSFRKGLISEARARQMARDLVAKLYKESAPTPINVYNQVNLKVLEQYLDHEYSDRELVDEKSMKADLTRAIEAVGHLSLISSTRRELQEQVDKMLGHAPNKQRRVVNRLSSLLKFLNRGFTLKKKKEVFNEVRHLSEDEVLKASKGLEHLLSLLVRVSFYTGCRLGELFALDSDSFRGNHLYIAWQIDEDGKKRLPKNRKARRALIVPNGVDAVKEWCELPLDEKLTIRNLKHAKVLSKACGRSEIKFHDLRHSYARYLSENYFTLDEISDFLGNSQAVAEKYYKGWIRSQHSIDAAFNRLSK